MIKNKSIRSIFFLILCITSTIDLYKFEYLNLRFTHIIFILLIPFVFNKLYYYNKNSFLVLFFCFVISTIFSYDVIASFQYTSWLFINYLILSYFYTEFIKNYYINFKLYVLSFRIISISVILIFIFGNFGFIPDEWIHGSILNIVRVNFWFYEPSYISIYLNIYLYLSLFYYINFNKLLDIYISLVAMLLTVSTTSFFAISFYILLFLYLNIRLIKILLIVFIYLFIYILFPDIFNFFLGRVFESGLDSASGGRVQSVFDSFDYMLNCYLIGCGPNIDKTINFLPGNITFELVLSIGFLGTFIFYIFLFKIISFKKINNNSIILIYGFISEIILLQSSQNYLRIYIWIYFGFLAGFFYIHHEKEKNINC